jgi:hypothetical protein
VGAAEVGVDFDRTLEPRQRFLELLELHVALANVVEGLGVGGILFCHQQKVGQSCLGVALMEFDQTASVSCPWMRRVGRQDAIENRLCRLLVAFPLTVHDRYPQVDLDLGVVGVSFGELRKRLVRRREVKPSHVGDAAVVGLDTFVIKTTSRGPDAPDRDRNHT